MPVNFAIQPPAKRQRRALTKSAVAAFDDESQEPNNAGKAHDGNGLEQAASASASALASASMIAADRYAQQLKLKAQGEAHAESGDMTSAVHCFERALLLSNAASASAAASAAAATGGSVDATRAESMMHTEPQHQAQTQGQVQVQAAATAKAERERALTTSNIHEMCAQALLHLGRCFDAVCHAERALACRPLPSPPPPEPCAVPESSASVRASIWPEGAVTLARAQLELGEFELARDVLVEARRALQLRGCMRGCSDEGEAENEGEGEGRGDEQAELQQEVETECARAHRLVREKQALQSRLLQEAAAAGTEAQAQARRALAHTSGRSIALSEAGAEAGAESRDYPYAISHASTELADELFRLVNDAYAVELGDRGLAFKSVARYAQGPHEARDAIAAALRAPEHSAFFVATTVQGEGEGNGERGGGGGGRVVGCIHVEISDTYDRAGAPEHSTDVNLIQEQDPQEPGRGRRQRQRQRRERGAEIGPFAVAPSWQGRGVGRALIARVEAWALRLGYTALLASVVNHRSDLYVPAGRAATHTADTADTAGATDVADAATGVYARMGFVQAGTAPCDAAHNCSAAQVTRPSHFNMLVKRL